jgi:hypothetical protein
MIPQTARSYGVSVSNPRHREDRRKCVESLLPHPFRQLAIMEFRRGVGQCQRSSVRTMARRQENRGGQDLGVH